MFESGLSKSHKKVNFLFLLNPVLLNGKNHEKQKRPGTSDQSLFILSNKFRKIPLLRMYYLAKFDLIICRCFLFIPKLYLLNLCKVFHVITNYSTFMCIFESERCGKEGKKLQTIAYLEKEEHFQMKSKAFFISFERVSFGQKKKKKIVDKTFSLKGTKIRLANQYSNPK